MYSVQIGPQLTKILHATTRKLKVRIFWKIPVFRKGKSPDLLEKIHFFKKPKLRILQKNFIYVQFHYLKILGRSLWRFETVHFHTFGPFHVEILKSFMSANSDVRIFRTSSVWREHKSPDFLDKPCLAKTQKSGFFGVRILSKAL